MPSDWDNIIEERARRDERDTRRQEFRAQLDGGPQKQRKLLDGMDCLNGQQDLFQTDGEVDA
jgi:hypothetical protein